MLDEKKLSDVISGDARLRHIEPHIYSAYPTDESGSVYDKSFGTVYDMVACNRFYNRILWGYWTSEFSSLTLNTLESSEEGWALDAGCGSLAFTAKVYAACNRRPVVLLDNSIKLLRMARDKMVKLCGALPDNMVFLHADALDMPFKSGSFKAIVALNLLHALDDAGRLLEGLKVALADEGVLSLTTLIENKRFSDGYLRMLSDKGLLVRRNREELLGLFDHARMHVTHRFQGNMAFVRYK